MRWFSGIALALAVLVGAARADEAEAAKRVEQLGGTVTRDDKQPGSPVTEVALAGPRARTKT